MLLELQFRAMPQITFFLRNNNDLANSSVLYCRVRYNKTVCEFSMKEKIDRKNWKQSEQKHVSRNKDKDHYINSLVESTSYRIKSKSVYIDQRMTAKELIQTFDTEYRERKLQEVVSKYIDQCKSSPGTIKNHQIKLQNLILFQNHRCHSFTLSEFGLIQANEFIQWFKLRTKTFNVTSANRNVLFYKQCLKWWLKQGNKFTSELLAFEGERDKLKTPIYLDENELQLIYRTKFMSDYLTRIRDLFVFQCRTGLSYCDLWSNWEIREEEFGTILTGRRGKNGQCFWLPIENPIVTEILKKYDFTLPKYHNSVYNRILKEIAGICGVNKRITTHTARKTFATTMDALGWTRETVSKMLGHKSVKTTEMYYLGESFKRLELEMRHRKQIA